MKIFMYYVLFSMLLLIRCEKILCDKTEFSALLNGNPWGGYIKSCDLESLDLNNDRTFHIIIHESKPVHDKFKDALILSRIPFEEGQYDLDSLNSISGVLAEFWVYEDEYGTSTETYSIKPFSGSFITVEEINPQSNNFVVRFNLHLSIHGGMDGQLHNSTYGKIITFTEGYASGYFMD